MTLNDLTTAIEEKAVRSLQAKDMERLVDLLVWKYRVRLNDVKAVLGLEANDQ